jgi:hypothetical protein
MKKRMRHSTAILVVALATSAPASSEAQAARIGRLPVLEAPPASVAACRDDPVNTELRRAGIARLVSVESADSNRHHLVSLGLTAKGSPVMLMALMGTRQGRRGESETVSVFLGNDGSIVRGQRSAFTTGTPTRLRDDRQRGLLAADTLAIRRLIVALRQRCRV